MSRYPSQKDIDSALEWTRLAPEKRKNLVAQVMVPAMIQYANAAIDVTALRDALRTRKSEDLEERGRAERWIKSFTAELTKVEEEE